MRKEEQPSLKLISVWGNVSSWLVAWAGFVERAAAEWGVPSCPHRITAVSEIREKTPGPLRKPSFYIRAINPLDWDGDGGRDLVAR